jgi:beta-lactamase class A
MFRPLAAAGLLAVLATAACDRRAVEAPSAADTTAAAPVVAPPPARDTVLEAAFREVAEGFDGVVGIAAWHLEEDVHAVHNGDEPFPMASVYKVPIAYAVMLDVAEGRLALDDSIAVTPSDYAPGSSSLALAGGRDGGRFAVRDIIRLSITESDNTASDVLLRLVGGGEEVTRRMRALGIEGLRVDRSVRRFISEWRGVGDVPDEWSLPVYEARAARVPPEERARAARAFEQDPRDTATPEAVAALLAAIPPSRTSATARS